MAMLEAGVGEVYHLGTCFHICKEEFEVRPRDVIWPRRGVLCTGCKCNPYFIGSEVQPFPLRKCGPFTKRFHLTFATRRRIVSGV
jgi:hypothetical protein